MNDRELLELAAKAAGMPAGEYCEPNHEPSMYHSEYGFWQPMADDGDALRLAVAANQLNLLHLLDLYGDPVLYKADPTAATRRAIVHAAAEIGKAMP